MGAPSHRSAVLSLFRPVNPLGRSQAQDIGATQLDL